MHWKEQKKHTYKCVNKGEYMFDKYFGFLRSQDEETILNSLLEHAQIDAEELHILSKMAVVIFKKDEGDLETMHAQICTINEDNVKIFESVADHIVQSNFDFQKQYDLLRIQQRIDTVSSLIIATSKRILIAKSIGTTMPEELYASYKQLVDMVVQSHQTFVQAIQKYSESRKDVIKLIHQAELEENLVDNMRAECLNVIYQLANDGSLRMGDFRAMEGIVEYFEDISDAIKSATTSLDWLLLN
jgi:uncharacterized protein Yka (UPF0111/DUF47 family)